MLSVLTGRKHVKKICTFCSDVKHKHHGLGKTISWTEVSAVLQPSWGFEVVYDTMVSIANQQVHHLGQMFTTNKFYISSNSLGFECWVIFPHNKRNSHTSIVCFKMHATYSDCSHPQCFSTNWEEEKTIATSLVCKVVSSKNSCHVCWTTFFSRSSNKNARNKGNNRNYCPHTRMFRKVWIEIKDVCCTFFFVNFWTQFQRYVSTFVGQPKTKFKNNARTKQKCPRENIRQASSKHQWWDKPLRFHCDFCK